MSNKQRQLAAILFTDIVGYTAMMQKDEQNAVHVTKKYVRVLQQSIARHGGQILNDYGDGSLCTFSSVTQALRCSIDMQREFQQDTIVPLRVGLHVGEIFFEGEKVMGDGVNITSRIQSLGEANTILFSREIFDKIRNQPEFSSVLIGSFEFKNVDEPMQVYALSNIGLKVPAKKDLRGKVKEPDHKTIYKRYLAYLVGLLLLACVTFFIFRFQSKKEVLTELGKSVVVLPFENYTNDSAQDALINGITEEITTQIAKISDIKVIGRTSAVQFKKSKKPLDQIADVLGVAAYLEGSVQKAGNEVRITAQLIDAKNQEHIWADSYVRNLNDVFSMQSEVAQIIAKKLHAKLTDEEKNSINKSPTSSAAAYQYYRRGRLFWDKRSKEAFDSAETNYKHAIELDPDYALAYSGLADLYIYNQKGLSQPEAIPLAREYAYKALSLDSTLAEALTTIGFIQCVFDYDWVNSKKTLEKAIAYNTNYSNAHKFYGNLLQYTGESTPKGLGEINKALELDPLGSNLNYVLGRNLYYAHQYDAAYEQLKKTMALEPRFSLAKGNLAYVLIALKRYPEAFQVIREMDSSETSTIDYCPATVRSYAYASTGNFLLAKTTLEESIRATPGQSPFFLAQVNVILKNYDEALKWLNKALASRDLWMYCIKVDPTFDPIRNEPGFKKILEKMNLE